MTTCRWDADAGDYLTPDGEKCRRDDYGDPTRHCTARRTCSLHVGPRELTCARCLGRTRVDLAQIVERSALMLPEAIEVGVDSEAAALAAPATDVRAWSERRIAMRAHLATWHADERITDRQYLHARATMEDDDETHPYSLLTRWEAMLREDYGHPRFTPTSITEAADYLDRHLGRIAQDPEQDFGLLARELRRCRSHLEAVLRDSRAPERGAPCPTCAERDLFVRLVREYPHYCDDEDCHQIHVATDELDVWRCPRNPEHWWNPAGYANLIKERRGA